MTPESLIELREQWTGSRERLARMLDAMDIDMRAKHGHGLPREVMALGNVFHPEAVVLGLLDALAEAEANNDRSVCVWCGEVGARDPDRMLAHTKACPKSPVSMAVHAVRRLHKAAEEWNGDTAEPHAFLDAIDEAKGFLEVIDDEGAIPIPHEADKLIAMIKDIESERDIRGDLLARVCNAFGDPHMMWHEAVGKVETLAARIAYLEAPGECQSLHKLRAERDEARAEIAAYRGDDAGLLPGWAWHHGNAERCEDRLYLRAWRNGNAGTWRWCCEEVAEDEGGMRSVAKHVDTAATPRAAMRAAEAKARELGLLAALECAP